jgi:hypothetical protein
MVLKSLGIGKGDGNREDQSVDAGPLLQEDLMRFEGRFTSRLVAAFAPLVDARDPVVRLRAAEDELKFVSAALDIAVAPSPEVNLLDMVTLVALGRDAMARRWTVEAHGSAAKGLAEAFEASLEDIGAIARAVTSDEVEAELRRVIHEWQLENPDTRDVTWVRLSAYAEHRETSAARDASGLFSAVRGAANTADSALLLAERALYAAQRLPFLLRTHARVGSSELVADLTRHHLLLKGLVACGGVALVATSSWFLARLAYRRLTTH